jgi:hypothetical protein
VVTAALLLLLGGCAAWHPASDAPPEATVQTESKHATEISPYLEVLSGMAPGDAARQQATLDNALAASQAAPTSSNRLRYALALGSAGPGGSNPVEARRLLTELLAGPNDLSREEKALAEGFAREFDARVTLYAELARQREEAAATLASQEASGSQRAEALAAENARLRRALAEADRKLKAVAEMERQLLEQASEADNPPPP